jgi:hypothetical protein
MGHGPLLSKSYWLAQLADDDNRLCPKKAAWATSKILRPTSNKTGIGIMIIGGVPNKFSFWNTWITWWIRPQLDINSHQTGGVSAAGCATLGLMGPQAVFLPKCLGAWNLHRCPVSAPIASNWLWILGYGMLLMFLWPYKISKRRLISPTTNDTLW